MATLLQRRTRRPARRPERRRGRHRAIPTLHHRRARSRPGVRHPRPAQRPRRRAMGLEYLPPDDRPASDAPSSRAPPPHAAPARRRRPWMSSPLRPHTSARGRSRHSGMPGCLTTRCSWLLGWRRPSHLPRRLAHRPRFGACRRRRASTFAPASSTYPPSAGPRSPPLAGPARRHRRGARRRGAAGAPRRGCAGRTGTDPARAGAPRMHIPRRDFRDMVATLGTYAPLRIGPAAQRATRSCCRRDPPSVLRSPRMNLSVRRMRDGAPRGMGQLGRRARARVGAALHPRHRIPELRTAGQVLRDQRAILDALLGQPCRAVDAVAGSLPNRHRDASATTAATRPAPTASPSRRCNAAQPSQAPWWHSRCGSLRRAAPAARRWPSAAPKTCSCGYLSVRAPAPRTAAGRCSSPIPRDASTARVVRRSSDRASSLCSRPLRRPCAAAIAAATSVPLRSTWRPPTPHPARSPKPSEASHSYRFFEN